MAGEKEFQAFVGKLEKTLYGGKVDDLFKLIANEFVVGTGAASIRDYVPELQLLNEKIPALTSKDLKPLILLVERAEKKTGEKMIEEVPVFRYRKFRELEETFRRPSRVLSLKKDKELKAALDVLVISLKKMPETIQTKKDAVLFVSVIENLQRFLAVLSERSGDEKIKQLAKVLQDIKPRATLPFTYHKISSIVLLAAAALIAFFGYPRGETFATPAGPLGIPEIQWHTGRVFLFLITLDAALLTGAYAARARNFIKKLAPIFAKLKKEKPKESKQQLPPPPSIQKPVGKMPGFRPTRLQCPKCQEIMDITSTMRPLEVRCSRCNAKLMLRR